MKERIAVATLAVLGTWVASPALAAHVVLDAPGHAAIEGKAVAARGGDPDASWTFLDWRGREMGVSGLFDQRGETAIPPLPTGYYVLWKGRVSPCASVVGSGDPAVRLATLAVVPSPETRPVAPDSFFGVDTAQSLCAAKGWFTCPWNGGDTFRTVSDLVRLAGFTHVRERMSWGRVNPEPDVFRYGDCLYNADLLRERGIGVSGMFDNTPARMAGRGGAAPSDLAAVHDACARFAADFGDRREDWECWNEPDLGPAPVWDYAAALKAASLGLRSGHPGISVLPGALCTGPKADYMRILYENDAAKFGDVFNYHTYANLVGYPEVFASLRSFLEEHGIGDHAIWMTECGTNLEGPALDEGAKEGLKAHSPAQELVLAEFYPKSQIALMMEGVARSYFFLFCPYNERGGTKDWGAMRRDGTVKPVFAAMSAMTRELSAARLVGEMKVGDGLRAYLFDQPDGSQTVAFWSESPIDTATGDAVVSPEPDFAHEWRLALPCGEFQRKAAKSECSQSFTNDNCSQMANAANVAFAAENAKVTLDFQFVDNDEQLSFVNNSYRLSDLCGMVSTVAATNGVLTLPSTRFPSYVSGLRGLVADVPPHPAGRIRRYEPGEDEDLSVVLRVDLDRGDFDIENGRTCARMKGDAGRLRVQVWNLGDTHKTGRVEVSGAALEGLPETIALGPRGTPPAEYDCVLRPEADASATPTLVLAGVFDERRSSRLAVPLLLEKRLFDGCETSPLAWRDRVNWTRNDSADTHSFTWDDAEAAWRWDVAWTNPEENRWFYPVYALAPGERLDGAVAIQFEARSAQDKVENDFRHSYCMMVQKGGDARWISYAPPVGTWERRVVFLREGDVPANVTAFRIGANPKGLKLSFWIRNLEIIRRKDK